MNNPVVRITSWNVKDFGKYHASWNMMMPFFIEQDIVVIQEFYCGNRYHEGTGLDNQTGVNKLAIQMAEELLGNLRSNDDGANWKFNYSGNNCKLNKNDAYAIFYKGTPSGSRYIHASDPETPSILDLQKVYIAEKDPAGNLLDFPDRMPGVFEFEVTSHDHSFAVDFHLVALHASVHVKGTSKYPEKSVLNSLNIAAFSNHKRVMLCGDLNVAMNTKRPFYKGLINDGYTVALGDPSGEVVLTSLKAKWVKGMTADNCCANAYDNFIYQNPQYSNLSHRNVGVNNFVQFFAEDSSDEERWFNMLSPAVRVEGLGELDEEELMFQEGCLSDHLPIYIELELTPD